MNPRILVKLAEKKDVDSCLLLGSKYYNGDGVKQDYSKALRYYTFAAEKNSHSAQCNLGTMYYYGRGVNQDYEKARYYYELSAEKGNSHAQCSLGHIYKLGQGVEVDELKALRYYKLAADQGHCNAQFYLGLMFYNRKGAKDNFKKAYQYFSLAAKQQDIEATYYLGHMYLKGEGVKQDYNKALRYLTFAADKNDTDAQSNLGSLYFEGSVIKKDYDKAYHYFSLAARNDNAGAQYNLGIMYFQGIKVEQNFSKAFSYFTLAAEKDNSEAQFFLGNMYYKGICVKEDHSKGIYYWTLAANQNHVLSQLIVGRIYYEGKDVQKDYAKAFHYLSAAADMNNADAQYTIGLMYCEGNGVDEDLEEAHHYLTMAAENNQANAKILLGFLNKRMYELEHFPQVLKIERISIDSEDIIETKSPEVYDQISDYIMDFSNLTKIKEISRGAFGIVYLMENNEKQKFAVKEIDLNKDQKQGEDFIREVNILFETSHPCIMKMHGYCLANEEEKAKIALEYLENGSLRAKMFDHSLSGTEKSKIVVGICLGMRYLHSLGIIHRDLKPENILLDSSLEVKIGDFGISKFYDESYTITKGIGTPLYSAPEIINDENYGISADVYSFGLILLEMVNKKPIYQNVSLFGLIHKKMKNEYDDISEEATPVIKEIIEACLIEERESRPTFDEIFEKMLDANFCLFEGEDTLKVKEYFEKVGSEETNDG